MRNTAMIVAIILAMIVVPSALANGGDEWTLSENDASTLNTMRDIQGLPTLPAGAINPATGSPYTTVEEFSGLSKARMAGGFLPALNTLTTIAIGGSAIYSAYQVGDAIRHKISGDSGASVGTFTPTWKSACQTGDGDAGSSCATGSSALTSSTFGSYGSINCVGWAGAPGSCWQRGWYISGVSFGGLWCTPSGVALGCSTSSPAQTTEIASIVAQGHISVITNSTTGSACPAVNSCEMVWRTFQQMRDALKDETCNTACYSGATIKNDNSTTKLIYNNTYLQDAKEACGGYLGSATGTADQAACRAAMNKVANPNCDASLSSGCDGGNATSGATVTCSNCSTGGGASYSPFPILEPSSQETYGDYLQRLRDKGWVGTATVTTVTTSPLTGPSGVVSVEDTTASLGPDSIAAWPTNPFTVPAASDAITLRVNDPTAPEVAPSPCDTCSIDWTPIESIAFGSAFPFGIAAWVEGFFGSVTLAGGCPTLSIGKPSSLGGGSIPISFCSTEWETTYRPIIFPILETLLTIAGIVFLAGKLTGYGNADQDGGG